MAITVTAEEIGGIIASVGAGVVIFKKYGLLTFGKPSERRGCPDAVQKVCQEHGEMRVHMSEVRDDVRELREGQKIIESDIKELLKRNGYRS